MLGEAIWSLKCQNWSAERAKKCNFRGFLNFCQKGLAGSCSYSLQMLSWPFPIIWHARIGCTISLRVTSKNRTVCGILFDLLSNFNTFWQLIVFECHSGWLWTTMNPIWSVSFSVIFRSVTWLTCSSYRYPFSGITKLSFKFPAKNNIFSVLFQIFKVLRRKWQSYLSVYMLMVLW